MKAQNNSVSGTVTVNKDPVPAAEVDPAPNADNSVAIEPAATEEDTAPEEKDDTKEPESSEDAKATAITEME